MDYPQKLPNNIIGLLKYNNFVINVVDIRFYLNIEITPYTKNNELLIVKTDQVIFGIITDKVIGILPFDTALVDRIPYIEENMIIEALYRNEQDAISIINVYSLEKVLKDHSAGSHSYDIKALFPQDEISREIMAKRSQNILEKSALRLASNDGLVKDKYISLNLNNDYYCLSLDYVKEILKDVSITNIPGTPDFIEGIINLRGDYITVINLKNFLGLPNNTVNEKKPVIIINCNELQLALLVDKVNELFEFQEITQEASSDSYYEYQFVIDTTLYTVLNIDKLSADKRIMVTDV